MEEKRREMASVALREGKGGIYDRTMNENISPAVMRRILNEVADLTRNQPEGVKIIDRKSTRLNSSHRNTSRMPSSA